MFVVVFVLRWVERRIQTLCVSHTFLPYSIFKRCVPKNRAKLLWVCFFPSGTVSLQMLDSVFFVSCARDHSFFITHILFLFVFYNEMTQILNIFINLLTKVSNVWLHNYTKYTHTHADSYDNSSNSKTTTTKNCDLIYSARAFCSFPN